MFLFNLLMLMLLSDTLMRVSGQTPNTIENHTSYQACITSPSTCIRLCVTRPRHRRRALPYRVARARRSSHEETVTASV